VQIRFLLGPAGSGKTLRCLSEIRAALRASADGPDLILLAPKQATFQLERQLLAGNELQGYTRLHIFSFERLARFVFEKLNQPTPQLLNEEGRVMVLRSLLAKKREHLKLFRASARLTGFAQQLSRALRELQRNQLTPESLNKLASDVKANAGLSLKLQDLATLLQHYLDWLAAHDLQDADCLLGVAAELLDEGPKSKVQSLETTDLFEIRNLKFGISNLWLDGFAELSPQELDLLAAIMPHCESTTLAFCIDHEPKAEISWLSHWSGVARTVRETKKRLEKLSGAKISVELLPRDPVKNRFATNPVLAHLENFWAEPKPYANETGDSLRLVTCANPEAEAVMAARGILHFIRTPRTDAQPNRFRDCAVIVRKLEGYHEALQRVFARYEIPFFLDRRESVSHHPLAELTRSALRTIAFQWPHEDWFAALKTGFLPAEETEIDRLENQALARGWRGAVWQQPIQIPDDAPLASQLEAIRKKIIPPFLALARHITDNQNRPTGAQLADALRKFWEALKVEQRLDEWADSISNDEQMNLWLENVALAFPDEALTLREWMPILEAGLSNLTVGVIPPALDQVLVGAIDRSRNPDIKLALVLGLNETVFPAPPEPTALLSDLDEAELEKRAVVLSTNTHRQLSRERYLAYIACTRARERLVLSCSQFDANDTPLNSSPFVSTIRQLFPMLTLEILPRTLDWREAEHANELIAPLIEHQKSEIQNQKWESLAALPGLSAVCERLQLLQNPELEESLAPELAERLYGKTLQTSVSRLEQFAACPFKFFVHSGLRAEERKKFELDVREQGSFQHDALKLFHEHLASEKKRWRDVTPLEARKLIGDIAKALAITYRDGLLQTSEQTRFMARVLTESLQDFIETLVSWMRGQYQFDPVVVELGFGRGQTSPAWELDLENGHRLAIDGRIDRVDICRDEKTGEVFCVVLDYKSSEKKLEPILIEHGLQLQLLTYLNVLRRWPNIQETFSASQLVPAGVFYVNLRGRYAGESNRSDALMEVEDARRLAYQHRGRFDATVLQKLDMTAKADQFKYRLKKDGAPYRNSTDPMSTAEFEALLDAVEENLKRLGREIFSGLAKVSPYRKSSLTACEQCDYQAICRIDLWTHRFRMLKTSEAVNETEPD
jgi:ATP-dependent helicase/nuclease subunit B